LLTKNEVQNIFDLINLILETEDFYVSMDIHGDSITVAKLGNTSVCRLVTTVENGEIFFQFIFYTKTNVYDTLNKFEYAFY
jgi:hypothetical protein